MFSGRYSYASKIGFEKADPTKLVELLGRSLGKTQGGVVSAEPIEGLGPQGGGESLIAQLDSAVCQAEQLRDQAGSARVRRPAGDLRPGEGRANRSAAI
jgi:hypothetical protein